MDMGGGGGVEKNLATETEGSAEAVGGGGPAVLSVERLRSI